MCLNLFNFTVVSVLFFFFCKQAESETSAVTAFCKWDSISSTGDSWAHFQAGYLFKVIPLPPPII